MAQGGLHRALMRSCGRLPRLKSYLIYVKLHGDPINHEESEGVVEDPVTGAVVGFLRLAEQNQVQPELEYLSPSQTILP